MTRFQVALSVDALPPPVDDIDFKPTQLIPRSRVESKIASNSAPGEVPAEPGTPAVIVDRPSQIEGTPSLDATPNTAASEPLAHPPEPVPSDLRTPGSAFVLPANPLHDLSDKSLEGFVDCTLYEESGNFFHPLGDEGEGEGEGNHELAEPRVERSAGATPASTVPAMPYDTPPDLTVRALGNSESLAVASDRPPPEAESQEARRRLLTPTAALFAPLHDERATSAAPWLEAASAAYGVGREPQTPSAEAGIVSGELSTAMPLQESAASASPLPAYPTGDATQYSNYTASPPEAPPNMLPSMMLEGTPGMQPGLAPGMQPGLAPGMQPGLAPGMMLEGRPGMLPGMLPELAPGMQPGMMLEGRPGMLPELASGMQPGMMLEGRPGMLPELAPGMHPELVPGMLPVSLPEFKPVRVAPAWQRLLLIGGSVAVAIVVAFVLARLARGVDRGKPAAVATSTVVVDHLAASKPAVGSAGQVGAGTGGHQAAAQDRRLSAEPGAITAPAAPTDPVASAGSRAAVAPAAPEPDDSADPSEESPPPDDDGKALSGGTTSVGSGPCRLTIATTPAGSILRFDDQEIGTSPITINGTCDKHKIDAVHVRYQSLTRWVTLSADKPQELDISLPRPIHAVTVTSFPSGAELSIDGHRAGTTPTVVQMMGFATVHLTFSKVGFRSVTKKVYSKLPQDRVFVKLVR